MSVSHGPWTAADVPGQGGRTAVVTGANSGIGFEAAAAFARHGAHTVLACRDAGKAAAAAARMTAAAPGATVSVVRLDLASLDSVRAAAAEILAGHQRLDPLINNAGLMWPGLRRDRRRLRVAIRYQSPRPLRALTRHLPRRAAIGLPGGRRAVHPGRRDGALPALRAATDPAAAGGEFYGPGGLAQAKGYPVRVSPAARSRDESARRRLWDESERLTGVTYPV